MRISELIYHLNDIKDKNGDINVMKEGQVVLNGPSPITRDDINVTSVIKLKMLINGEEQYRYLDTWVRRHENFCGVKIGDLEAPTSDQVVVFYFL